MNANTGKPWSEVDLFELGNSLGRGQTMKEVADLLCREVYELHAKLRELGLSPADQRQQ